MTVITALKPSRMAIAGSADAGPRPRAITFCTPVTRYRNGMTEETSRIQFGAKSSGLNAPPRNAIGKMIRLAIEVAACCVLETPPTRRPVDMNARVQQIPTGIAIHQDEVSFSPK